MKAKTVLIFSGGTIYDYAQIKEYINGDMIICADGGAKHLRVLDLVPDILLGDFDSINTEDYQFFAEKNAKIIKYPEKKDFTDSELAIEQAVSHGATQIILFGATGEIGSYNVKCVSSKKNSTKKYFGKIVTGKDEMFLVKDHATIKRKGYLKITLLALDNEVKGITTNGLYYKLEDDTIFNGSSRGVSNFFEKDVAKITIKEGILMVILS